MVTLHYGIETVNVKENSKFLSASNQKLLLDGRFVLETGIAYDADEKVRKLYYIGVLYEIFKANYEEFSNLEIIGMMLIAYPIFMKPRQVQNVIAEYYKLKSRNNVFAAA